jgi:Undecaprenyl-phosphate glucose phosphotransferase
MLKRYQHTLSQLFLVADAVIVVAAWLVAYHVRFYVGPLPATKGLPPFETYAALAPWIAALWTTVFLLTPVYETRRVTGAAQELRTLVKAHGSALLCFIVLTYLFEEYKYSRLVMAYFAALSGVALIAFHLALRELLSTLRAFGFRPRQIVLAGEGAVLERLLQRRALFSAQGLEISGVVVRDEDVPPPSGTAPVLGHFAEICEIVRRTRADEVLIALPPAQSQKLDDLLDSLKDETVDVRVVLDVDRYVTLSCEVEEFDGLPVVRINDSPLFGWGALAKRATDVALSAAALVVLSPLLCAIGVLVKLTSRGPMLYAQERMGLDGRSFRMWKFRSMRVDAEAQSGAVWASASDGRRTAFGTFLRKTSLDELPQLWNVVRGDMSLVGPRPERPVFVDRFRKQIPHYMLRHKVQAGITGWAQVNGWRGNTSLDRRIECDLFYIRNWSYALDLKILTLTLWKGFVHKNAY